MVPLLIGGAATIALAAALLLWAGSPSYGVLFSNLSEADGGSIINELDTRGVPYRFSEGGNAILVPADQVHTLRLQLAEQGLPEGGTVGFELLDNQAFGVSQFTEQVNFQRGLEGELARSIETLGPVASARVHLALPKPSVFMREREPAKASVVLTLHPGRTLGYSQVNAIMHLVSSSVPNLTLDQVTVVDQAGGLLSTDPNPSDRDGADLDYVSEVEQSYRQRIENILTPLFGRDNFSVEVSADIDFSRREQTTERFTPNQTPGSAAVRSAQLSGTFNGEDVTPAGIPGALSNTPPGPGLAPIELEPAATAVTDPAAALPAAAAARNNLDYNRLVNYEVDHDVTHLQQSYGQLQRLSAAVAVNYREGMDAEGAATRLPLSAAELDQVTRLARQAMGYSETRGDALEVVNVPFSQSAVPIAPEAAWWSQPGNQVLLLSALRYLVAAFAIVALYLLILRPLVRRQPQPIAALPATAGNAAGALGASAAEPQLTEDMIEGDYAARDEITRYEAPPQPPLRQRTPPNYDQYLRDVRQIAQDDPRLIALVVRNWIEGTSSGK
jgi:flagellar M-ring protein FliF